MGTMTGLKAGLLVGLLAVGGAASAGAVPISGTGALGSFTGSLTYGAASNTAATLNISLTNTSPAANGGFITAFVLNNPGNRITSAVFTDKQGGGSFGSLGIANNGTVGNNGVNGAPNGQFDFGASTGDGFEGGGKPQEGIAVGASDSFTFALTGTGLMSLTADSFLTALSSGTGSGDGYAAFDVRFRGFNDKGSDKVTFTGTTTPPGGGTPVPEPASMALLGAGLMAMGFVRRRRTPV